jgi:outer membrane protein OmpA-like peptidoglycan-associated protein
MALVLGMLASAQFLAGCNTVGGMGRDIQSAGRAITGWSGTSEDQASSVEASTSPAAGKSAAAETDGTVYFSLGGAELSADARSVIDAAVADVKGQNSKRVKVIGYTDTSGSSDANEQLSVRRAKSVADELAAQGVPRDMIDVSGRGESDLAVPTGDGVVEAKNRRATIEVST